MNILNEIDKPIVKKTVVVYAGRFQPFHNGHYAAYKRLVSKFGRDNVYIGTSNDTSGPKSPFNFNEKKKIATTMFGIPDNHFVNIKNPYKPVEILKSFDGKTTQYIAAVGEKDATRLHGKYFKPYQGKAGYGYEEIGYVWPVPAEKDPISGTDVRNYLGGDDENKAKSFFLKAYPKFNQEIFDMITDKIKSKKMQSISEYGAKTMGTGMAGDFGPKPNDDEELTEDGLPGGAFTGLVSPGGYINGAPKPKDVKRLSKKLHKGDDTESHQKYVYNPIAEILGNIAAEELFKEFVQGYFGEAENPVMDKDIKYKKADGTEGSIKVKDALRLKKDHPAHIQADKMIGAEKPQPKQKEKSGAETEKGEKKDGKETAGKSKAGGEQPKGPEPKKLPAPEFKDDAEKTPEEKKQEAIKQSLDSQRKQLSPDENKDLDKMNNPESPERKSMGDRVMNGLKKFGKGMISWGKHKKEMMGDSMGAVKDLATTGKLGAVKDKDGKNRHWSEFSQVGRGGGSDYEEVETDELDHHGHPTGNKVLEKKPKIRENATDEERDLFEKSWERTKNQKKQLKHLAKDTAILLGSMALGGGLVAGIGAAAGGAGATATLGAAGSGAIGAFTHGAVGFGVHLGKDIVKHATLETLGLSAVGAGIGGAGLSAATGGILEGIDDSNETVSRDKFIKNLLTTVAEKIKTYKLSDEQMINSIKRYKKDAGKRQQQQQIATAANLLKEVVSKSKVKNIADFVGYSAKRLKLKNKPNIKLILGNTYSEQNGSLGGYSSETKDIYVVVPKRMTADICRTIAHELVHRKQDEMGIIKNSGTAGKTGSPIENQANAVAGILLRDYGKINKEIYSESLIIETSNLGITGDDQPNGAWLPKGARRKLGADDGVNKSDYWFHNGGYIQLEFPEADKILGDEDENQIYVKYVTKNVPRQKFDDKFTTNPDKVKIISEMGRNDIHFKNVFTHYRDGDAKMKQKIAKVVTGNPYAKIKEIIKDLREMDHNEIEEVEAEIGIPIKEQHGDEGGWYGGGAKRWVDDNENDYTDTTNLEDINVDVNTGDEVLMGKFKNKKVQVKDIGKDKHGMPTINGKQATTFRTVNEGNYIAGGMQDDQSFRSPYTDKWERFDDRAQTHAEIVGYTVIGHTSDHYPQKKKGVVMPSKNPKEENGPGKRWIHPSKGEDYANEKKEKWEMYPF